MWVFFVSNVCVLESIIVVHIYHGSKKMRIPACIRTCFFGGVAKYIGMRDSVPSHKESEKRHSGVSLEAVTRVNNAPDDRNTEDGHGNGLNNDLYEIKCLLGDLRKEICGGKEKRAIEREWKALAKIIDRFCFWLCLVLVIIITVCVFMGWP